MKRVVLASNNNGKIKEFRAILYPLDIVTPADLGLHFEAEETGSDFFENALIKARALYELCGEPTLADDSGLCVDALGGAPGVYSARYSGKGDKENIVKLLRELNGVTDRRAHFTSCIVYYDGDSVISAVGETYGKIASAPIGDGGFGYDPVFISDDLGKSFGEATAEEKNSVSHRFRALELLRDKLGTEKIK